MGPVGPEEASPSAPVGKTPSVRENIIENVTQILERDRSERLVVRVLPPGSVDVGVDRWRRRKQLSRRRGQFARRREQRHLGIQAMKGCRRLAA